jgi:hypothetical protein
MDAGSLQNTYQMDTQELEWEQWKVDNCDRTGKVVQKIKRRAKPS